MTIITSFKIYPNFYEGFEFVWDINSTFSDPFPWVFIIEESPTLDKFRPITTDLTNVFRYQEPNKRLASKDNNLYFRLKLTTPKDTYYSDIVGPHWQLNRQEFLMARKIMHDEYLGQRNHVGVLVDIWIRATYGLVCSCVDPITRDVITTNCTECWGTGRKPGYHGPYTTWCTFSPLQKTKGLQQDGTDVLANYAVTGRITAIQELKKDDILIDKESGRHYYIDTVQNVAELRRTPIAQMVGLKQIPTSDFVYKIGE